MLQYKKLNSMVIIISQRGGSESVPFDPMYIRAISEKIAHESRELTTLIVASNDLMGQSAMTIATNSLATLMMPVKGGILLPQGQIDALNSIAAFEDFAALHQAERIWLVYGSTDLVRACFTIGKSIGIDVVKEKLIPLKEWAHLTYNSEEKTFVRTA